MKCRGAQTDLRVIGVCFIAFIIVVSVVGDVLAQGPPPMVNLSVPYSRQETLVWCWVAAAKMAIIILFVLNTLMVRR